MMEQTNTGKGHRDIVFVTGINHIIVTDRTAGLGDILNAGPVSPFDVVAKGEESVGAQSDSAQGFQPFFLFLSGKRLRLHGEKLLPDTVSQHIHVIVGNINVDGIIPVGTADVLLEG